MHYYNCIKYRSSKLLFILIIHFSSNLSYGQDSLSTEESEYKSVFNIYQLSDLKFGLIQFSNYKTTLTIEKTNIPKLKSYNLNEHNNKKLFSSNLLSTNSIKLNRFYIFSSYGNSYPIFKQLLGENIDRNNIDQTPDIKRNQVYSTYGGGWNWNLGCGLLFNDRFGLELNFMSFYGQKGTISNKNLNMNTKENWSINEITSTKTNAIFNSINGSFIFKYYWFYSKTGIIGADIKIKIDSSYSRDYYNISNLNDSSRTTITQYTSKLPNFGFTQSLGLQIPIGKHFAFYIEANIIIMEIEPYKMSYIEVKEQGNTKPNPNDKYFESNKDLKKKYPIYSWGWNGGIKLFF